MMRASLLVCALLGVAKAADLRVRAPPGRPRRARALLTGRAQEGVPGIIRQLDEQALQADPDFLEFEEQFRGARGAVGGGRREGVGQREGALTAGCAGLGHYEFLEMQSGEEPSNADPQNLAPRQLECYCKFVKEKAVVAPASAYNNMDPSQGRNDSFVEKAVELSQSPAAGGQQMAQQEGVAVADEAPRFAERDARLQPRGGEEPEGEEADEEQELARRLARVRAHRRQRRGGMLGSDDDYVTDLVEEDARMDPVEEALEEEERQYRLELARERRAHRARLMRLRERYLERYGEEGEDSMEPPAMRRRLMREEPVY